MASKERSQNVDLGLTALAQHAQHGQQLSRQDIAEVCQCSVSYIQYLEHRALDRLRQVAARHRIADFNEAD